MNPYPVPIESGILGEQQLAAQPPQAVVLPDAYTPIKLCSSKITLRRTVVAMSGATSVVACAADSTRIGLIFAAGNISAFLDIVASASGLPGMPISVNSGPLKLDYDTWGPLVQQQWYATASGPAPLQIYEILVNP